MIRSVLFIDPPAFVATVERLVAPALRSRPLAVAPPGADRATVLALSPEAGAAGIVRGMPVRQARKLCPDLVLLPPNPRLYARASRALHEILRVYAPVIEPRGYGHAFLDLTGTERLFGPMVDVAERIRREAATRLRLPLTVGAAVNKLVSEAATRVGRLDAGWRGGGMAGRPGDRWPLLVPDGTEAPFLAPHPVQLLPEVPEDILFRLDEYQLERIGQVAAIPESELCAVFGTRGRLLRTRSRGIDARPVLPPEVRSEYRLAHTLASDTNDRDILHALLRRLTETLGRRLRRRRLAARRILVDIEYADYSRASRALTLPPESLDRELWDGSRRALALAMTRRVAVRTVAVTVDRLIEARAQLDLFDPPADSIAARTDALQRAVDAVSRQRLPPPAHRSPRKDDLPHGRVALHRGVRRGGLGHREDPVDHRPEHRLALRGVVHAQHRRIVPEMGPEERQHPLRELGHERRALLQHPGAHHGADDFEPLPENGVEVGLGGDGPLQEAEQHQAAAGSERREIVLKRGAAQDVQYHIHRDRQPVAERSGGGIDAEVEAQRPQRLELGGGARGAHDGGADHLGNLHRGGADPARHRVHQHRFAAHQPAPNRQRIVGGEKGLRDRRRFGPRQGGGYRERLLLVHDDVLGVGAAADQSHDPVARSPAGHSGPR
ncbi:MAG TPA: hypothetical protein VF187_04905 [Gemmatimonadales bacterium]